jgi:hypothetical protein
LSIPYLTLTLIILPSHTVRSDKLVPSKCTVSS